MKNFRTAVILCGGRAQDWVVLEKKFPKLLLKSMGKKYFGILLRY